MKASTHSLVMSELLEISENSYFRWKKKDHTILINLLEKYFIKEELQEFLETGKIKRFESEDIIFHSLYQVCSDFFGSSLEPKNKIFASTIFPTYTEWQKKTDEAKHKLIQDRVKKINEMAGEKKFREDTEPLTSYTQKNLIKFLIKTDLFIGNKEDAILTIAQLRDFEVYLLITYYQEFLKGTNA